MYRVDVWGGGVYFDDEKERAWLDAKRRSTSDYLDTEVWVWHNGAIARKYYNGRICENYEED